MVFVTPKSWAEAQLPHLSELLIEQAHLEKKAAACAISFMFRLPARGDLHRTLSMLAREELVHLERTVRLLQQRGIELATQSPCDYAAKLKAAAATTMPMRLVDELVIAGIIESRSHERMGLLARALADSAPDVAEFYADLCAAEERHEQVYLDLAAEVVTREEVLVRHRLLQQHEARVLHELPWSPRLHSGVPEAARV